MMPDRSSPASASPGVPVHDSAPPRIWRPLHTSLLGLVLAAIAVTCAVMLGGEPALGDGDVLGPENAEAARDLLPEEIFAHYQRGDYQNRIIALGQPGQRTLENPPDFRAASEANRGRYRLAADGSIAEVATGTQPAYVLGLPFPEIDAKDPEAGAKIVWNFFYANAYRGDYHFLTELVMLGRRGVERRIQTDVVSRSYDGNPDGRDRPNPQNLFVQTLAKVVSPADMAGTLSLTWRHRDPGRADSVWTYVPGLRRARQVSPLNRSDGFLGSDLSQDDGSFFDAKPEDFSFRLVERRDQLVLVDPFSVAGEAELVPAPGGGWRTVWKDTARIGADDSTWRGLPWAPVSSALTRRAVWVVDAVPHDPNYLYGRIVLRIDAETYRGSWATKYDRADLPMSSYQVSVGAYYTPPEGAPVAAGGIAVQTSENLLYRRATVVLFPPRNPSNPADWRVPTSAENFSPDVLMRLGR